MTPRQLGACLDLAIDRRDREQALAIEAARLGAHGAGDDIQGRLTELAR
jgi:hypothetical protein